jgi:hypothetical protein
MMTSSRRQRQAERDNGSDEAAIQDEAAAVDNNKQGANRRFAEPQRWAEELGSGTEDLQNPKSGPRTWEE